MPQKIRLAGVDKAAGVFFRVNKVMAAGTVKVTSGDTQIASFKRQHMAPGEMEQIQLPKALLEKAHGTVTISVEEANA